MRILIVSDTHRKHRNLAIAVKRVRPEFVLHLGDVEGCADRVRELCGCPVVLVAGNCDRYGDEPIERVLELGKQQVFLTHGHKYRVNYGNDMLIAAARQHGCTAALYGHTHCPELVEEGGITVFNPGSISNPRQYNRLPSYGILTVDDQGELHFAHGYIEDGAGK